MWLVPDQRAVQQFVAAGPHPAFHDRVHAGYLDTAEHDRDAGGAAAGDRGGAQAGIDRVAVGGDAAGPGSAPVRRSQMPSTGCSPPTVTPDHAVALGWSSAAWRAAGSMGWSASQVSVAWRSASSAAVCSPSWPTMGTSPHIAVSRRTAARFQYG